MKIEYIGIALILLGLTLIITTMISHSKSIAIQTIGIMTLSIGIIVGTFIPKYIEQKQIEERKQMYVRVMEIPEIRKQSIMYKELPMTKLNPLRCRLYITTTHSGRII